VTTTEVCGINARGREMTNVAYGAGGTKYHWWFLAVSPVAIEMLSSVIQGAFEVF